MQEEELPKLLVSNEINPKAWGTMLFHACLIKRSIIHSINFRDVLAVKARAGILIRGRAYQHQRLKFQSHLSMVYISAAATVRSNPYSALRVCKPVILILFQFRPRNNNYEVQIAYTVFLVLRQEILERIKRLFSFDTTRTA
jgi:hypothetical protein